MKRFFTILWCVLLSTMIFAQAPATMDFQSLIRDASGNFVANRGIGVKINIRQKTATGTAVYTETHSATTNANGLLTLSVGAGTKQSTKTFADIDWSKGPYFIQVHMDLSGGTNYTLSQTTQIMSVPYALYAQTAGKVASSGTKDDYEARIAALEQLTIGKNPHYPVSHDEIFSSDGAVLAEFSVSATTKVYFSRGNLQYQASTRTWRFAPNQYTRIGSGNANISNTYTGWIDLFGWGTGNNPTNSSADATQYGTFVDWGKNAISNGGNKANSWRTLTHAEWDYMLKQRTDAKNKSFYASVNGVVGIILLPDTWTGTLPSYNVNATASSPNVYNLYKWDIFESAGAIFLPNSGRRERSKSYPYDATEYVDNANNFQGYYWTATKNYIVSQCSSSITTSASYTGYAVRLVRNVQ